MRVTIKDVAAAAGVSAMTVSNVINGRTRYVGERTRKNVQQHIERLGYRIHNSGRRLRLGRHNAIGMIMVDESPTFLANPFMSNFVAGLNHFLGQNNYTLVVQGLPQSQFANSLMVRSTEVDVYCVKMSGRESSRKELLQAFAKLGEPCVFIEETLPYEGKDYCVVRQNDTAGGRMMAKHLTDRGVKSVVIVTPEPDYAGPMIASRLKGFRAGLRSAEHDVQVDRVIVPTNEFEAAQLSIKEYLQSNPVPDAFVGANDHLAIAAMRVVQERGLDVPNQVRIAGFNGFESAQYTVPTLTTVRSDAYNMGQTAGRLALQRVETGAFETNEIVFPVEFSAGGSS